VGGDTLNARQQIEGIITSYMTNYSGPQPFTFPAVVVGKTYSLSSAELIDSTRFGQADASVGANIVIRYPQISPVDPYMVALVNKTRQDSINGNPNTRRILRLNPGLLTRLSARANDNLAAVIRLQVVRCGTSYTTVSGNSWYLYVGAHAHDRRRPAGVRMASLVHRGLHERCSGERQRQRRHHGGKRYLYSFVTRSRVSRTSRLLTPRRPA
jgi:hypothetical protein